MRPQEQKGAVELGLHSSIADCQKKATGNGFNVHIFGKLSGTRKLDDRSSRKYTPF